MRGIKPVPERKIAIGVGLVLALVVEVVDGDTDVMFGVDLAGRCSLFETAFACFCIGLVELMISARS